MKVFSLALTFLDSPPPASSPIGAGIAPAANASADPLAGIVSRGAGDCPAAASGSIAGSRA